MMKIGVYVDAANINQNGGYSMKYDTLKNYCSINQVPIRLNTYIVYDKDRAEQDWDYKEKQFGYFSILREFGYKVLTKPIRWFYDEDGRRTGKANADLDMAVDMLIHAKNLDKIYILTGDGDFAKAVQAVQNIGVRVELIAFKNVSRSLIFECDSYTSGYMIPNLLPIEGQAPRDWGTVNARVRGICYAVNDGYGFLRFMKQDHSLEEVFFHFSELPEGVRARLEHVYEFTLVEGERGLQAKNITLV